jgi:hypothetical protein
MPEHLKRPAAERKADRPSRGGGSPASCKICLTLASITDAFCCILKQPSARTLHRNRQGIELCLFGLSRGVNCSN